MEHLKENCRFPKSLEYLCLRILEQINIPSTHRTASSKVAYQLPILDRFWYHFHKINFPQKMAIRKFNIDLFNNLFFRMGNYIHN